MSDAAPTVRVLRPDEWGLAKDLRLTALRDHPYAFLGTLEQAENMPEAAWRRTFTNSIWLIAQRETRSVGMVRIRSLPEAPHELYLESVWVHPDDRRSGVLRRLLSRTGHEAQTRGVQTVRLAVLHGNEFARKVFESLGFKLAGDPDTDEQQFIIDSATLKGLSNNGFHLE